MVKFKPGIPTGFNLDVEPVHDLGDYLDEPGPKPLPSRGPKESRSTPESPAVMPTPTRPGETAEPAMVTTAIVQTTEPHPFSPIQFAQEPTPRQESVARSKAPRREISMTPDTLRMSDELLELIRGGSGQRDTKANELFHALVLLAYEVRGELDVHTIPKRGQWGTPTARAYPLEIRNVFLRAILKKYAGVFDNPNGLRYPVNNAA